MINEVQIFAGKARDLEMPIEARQALKLKDSDQVEIVLRRKKRTKTQLSSGGLSDMADKLARHKLFVRVL